MLAKNYHLHWIAGRTNILCKYIIYIFFNFGRGVYGSFLLLCTSIFMSSKSVSQIFKILFQTGDINIFVLRGVFFIRYVQLKSSFSDEKNISAEI